MTKPELLIVHEWIRQQRDLQRPITQNSARRAKANPQSQDCASFALMQAGKSMFLNDSLQLIEVELTKLISMEN